MSARKTRPRGPNAERRAATRAKILDGAVRCLCARGYSGTTTPIVARMAGVARGSLLHQFPTKVDLILAVAQHAARKQGAEIRAHLAEVRPGRRQFVGVVDAVWGALQKPEGTALIEIMMATRTDKILARRYPAFARDFERALQLGTRRFAASLGLHRSAALERVARFTLTALRGLAVESHRDARATKEALALLRAYRGAFFDRNA